MLWAFVAASGIGSISPAEGRIDEIKYLQTLEASQFESVKKDEKMRRGWLLHRGNDPEHTLKFRVKYEKKLKAVCFFSHGSDSLSA